MMDLAKQSHERYRQTFTNRLLSLDMSLERRDLYLDMANRHEMSGRCEMADKLRRFALGLPQI